jgi:uncharacterized protein (TIGR02217 family)
MSFLETPRFPLPPALGVRVIPRYSTTKTARASGAEFRNRNWAEAQRVFEFDVEHLEADIAAILEYHHAVGGEHVGFRFKDWTDFKSCRGHLTPAPTDQPLVQISGLTYQLTKRYTAGALSSDRRIRKPVAGTITVADGGTPLTLGTGFTVDTTTGIVTLASAPSGAVTWGGEFDVPVRFDGDQPFELTFRDDSDAAVQAVRVVLLEIKL